MQQVITPKVSDLIASHIYRESRKAEANLFTRLLAWCKLQQETRLLWMGLAFFGLTILAIPCLALPYLLSGVNNMNLWMAIFIVNVPVITIFMANQPTKIALPVMFFSWAINFVIIISVLFMAVFVK